MKHPLIKTCVADEIGRPIKVKRILGLRVCKDGCLMTFTRDSFSSHSDRIRASGPNLRRLLHASPLLVPVIVKVSSRFFVLIAVSTAAILYTLEEVLRLNGVQIPILTDFTLSLSREGERRLFIVRPLMLAIGILAALLFFPENIAYGSLAIVAGGDSAAAIVGERFGRARIRGKSLEGFTAGLIAASILSSIFVSPILAFVGSTAAMLIELAGAWIEPLGAADNFTMPITAGVAMILLGARVLC